MHHYILIWRADDFYLVGPFRNNASAAEYGRVRWGMDAGDNKDPRWNTIYLENPHLPVVVRSPT